jgi:hypothetical protein
MAVAVILAGTHLFAPRPAASRRRQHTVSAWPSSASYRAATRSHVVSD